MNWVECYRCYKSPNSNSNSINHKFPLPKVPLSTSYFLPINSPSLTYALALETCLSDVCIMVEFVLTKLSPHFTIRKTHILNWSICSQMTQHFDLAEQQLMLWFWANFSSWPLGTTRLPLSIWTSCKQTSQPHRWTVWRRITRPRAPLSSLNTSHPSFTLMQPITWLHPA